MSLSVHIDRLSGALGAVVTGFDLTSALTPGERDGVLELLDRHHVVAFEEQGLDLDRLEALTDELGGRDLTPYIDPVPGRPHVIRVLKEPGDELNFANAWHTDLSYLAEPPAFTVLSATVVPAVGGDTIWANQHLAYDTLPDHLRERLLMMTARHSAGVAYGTGGYLERVADKSSMTIAPSPEAHTSREHPVVIAHPRTGRAALYVNPVYTTEVVGPDGDPDPQLLARLVTHATHPNLTCRLRWRAGMVAIWDNAATQHLAINDYADERREMYRTSVRGAPLHRYASAAS